jgi:predicted metalloprotease with PDZ domain
MHTRRLRPSPSPALLPVLALLLACAPASRAPEWSTLDGTPGLAYRMVLDELGLRASVRVELVVRAPAGLALPSPLRLVVPHEWGGQTDLGDDVLDLQAEDERGAPLAVLRAPGLAELRHQGAAAVRVSYRLRPRARELDAGTRFRALGTPELFVAYGRNLFVRPEGGFVETEPVQLVLETERQAAVWVTTLGGAGPSLRLRAPSLGPVLDAAFAAGRPRVVTDRRDAGFTIAADPALDLLEDAVLEIAQRVVAYQTMAYGPPSLPTTTGLLLRRADEALAATGTGRPGGFVLELGDARRPDDREVAELLAHENLHRYLGFDVTFDGPSALETLWLKEGVVCYLASLTVVQAGLAPPDAYLDALSRALTGYLSDDAHREPVTDADALGYWWDSGQRRRPYERGFLLGFWLDQRLRRGGDRLERAIGALIAAHRGGPPLTLTQVSAFFAVRARDPEVGVRIEAYVRDGTPLPWEEWLTEAGLRWREERSSAAYLGIEATRERGGTWRVTAIDPAGPAARSSLRVGDRLHTFPDAARLPPTSTARLDVLRDGLVLPITLRPDPGLRREWRVTDPGEFAAARGWTP